MLESLLDICVTQVAETSGSDVLMEGVGSTSDSVRPSALCSAAEFVVVVVVVVFQQQEQANRDSTEPSWSQAGTKLAPS